MPRIAMKRMTAVLAAILTLSAGSALASSFVDSLSFQQSNINLYGGNAVLQSATPNSDWGSLDYTYMGTSSIQYFNLTVDGVWRVQNMPLLSNEGFGNPSTLTFNFSLGNTVGTAVPAVSYGYSTTLATKPAAPAMNNAANLTTREINAGTAEGGNLLGLTAAPGSLLGGVGGFNSAGHANFPNQDCGINFCAPVSVSNSLQFLNAKHNLGMAAADISTAAIAAAIGTTGAGTPLGWWNQKDAYMKAKKLPITTVTSASAQDAIDAIKAGKDVELGGGGHRAALVGIAALDDGRYAIDVAHDTNQGNAGGTKIERGILDPTTGKITGITFWNNADFRNFVIESPVVPIPEPETYALMLAGLATVAVMARRRKASW